MTMPTSPTPPFGARKPLLLSGTRGLAVVAGLLAASAQPPWGFAAGLLGFGLLMRMLDRLGTRARWRSAFALGWLAGFGYFIPSLVWLAHPFEVDAQAQGWMAPIAVGLMGALLAMFWGAAAVAYRAVAGKGPRRVLLFAAALGLAEWLRGHVLTGFPWDLPGESWRAGSAPSQAAALVGAYGLTWITIVAATAPSPSSKGGGGG